MLVVTLEGIIWQILSWYVPAVFCYFAWPVIRRERTYIVAAAMLCLTPMFASYGFLNQWPDYYRYPHWLTPVVPLAASLPEVIVDLPGSLKRVALMGLPSGAVLGTIAWFMAPKVMAPRIGTQALRLKPASRYGRLRTALRRLGDLLILLAALLAYVQLLHIPLIAIARLLR